MSKLGCICGHVIRDTHYDLPYKGDVRRDQDFDFLWDTIIHELALFTEAVVAGRRDEWIDRHFLPGYPQSQPDESVISDYLSGLNEKFTLQILECENCGRLWVQDQPQADSYLPYSPDSGRLNRVLASARHARPAANADDTQ